VDPQTVAAASVDTELRVAEEAPQILIVDDSPVDRRIAERLMRSRLNVSVRHAEHGVEALALMADRLPDLVLTDLDMPEMDGLALVESIRSQFPLVPTILMTANGSEDVAIEALRRGAASYVSKRRLSSYLAETVQDVLAVSRQRTQQRRLSECWAQTLFEFHLNNDTTLIPVLIAHLQEYLRSVRHCDETELVRMGVALTEALQNAVYHGNLEVSSKLRETSGDAYYLEAEDRRRRPPYAGRRVRLSAHESRDEARYVIRDEGPGFDVARVLADDPTDPQNVTRPSGRGLFLIRMFMSEVRFNPAGNEITMVHRRQAVAIPPEAEDWQTGATQREEGIPP
jgi:CheY-like chemotaxis protein